MKPFIETPTVAMPYVHELMLPIKSIALNMTLLDVLTLFDIYSELHALSIQDNGNFIGLITRCHYANQIPREHAEQLFANKNLKTILETEPAIFSTPLIADVDDRIDQIMEELLTFGLQVEILPVSNNQGILGVVKYTDMMLRLLEMQNTYINDIIKNSERLRVEVRNATVFQQNLLRHCKIDLLGLRGLATSITCSEISGDFYDYYAIDERWVVLLVGDVSGHGIASGTVVSISKAIMNLIEIDKEIQPYKILDRLNNAILKTAKRSLLMTMFAACLDTQTGELRYANAGHQFPYHYRSIIEQADIMEEACGLPLGQQANTSYEQHLTHLHVGDCLFMYTDAIVEEENSQGECFGYDRLEDVLKDHIKNPPEHLRDVLLERFISHIERDKFGDDITFLHVEFYQHGASLVP